MRSVKLATIVITAAASLFAAAQLKAQVVQTSIPLTFQPGPIAVDPGLNQIYFGTYYGAKQLTILNGSTNAMSTLALPVVPLSLAINTVTHTLYVTGFSSGDLTVVNLTTSAITTVTLPGSVAALGPSTVDETANKVYLTASNATSTAGSIIVLDGASNAVDANIALSYAPAQVAVDSSANKFYATLVPQSDPFGYFSFSANEIVAVDGATNTTTYIPTAGSIPDGIAVDPTNHRVFVLNTDLQDPSPVLFVYQTIAVIDGTSDSLLTTRKAGFSPTFDESQPGQLLIDSTRGRVYALGGQELINGQPQYTITVLDEPSLTTLSPHGVLLNGYSSQLVLDAAANRVYATTTAGLTSADGSSFLPSSIPIGTSVLAQEALNPTTNKLYLATRAYDPITGDPLYSITVIDTTGGSTANLTLFPSTVDFSSQVGVPSTQTIYLANTGSAPMNLTNLEYNSPNPSQVVQSNECANPIAAHSVCPIQLTYTPSTPSITNLGPFEASAQPGGTTSIQLSEATYPSMAATYVYPSTNYQVSVPAGTHGVNTSGYLVGAAYGVPTGTVTVYINGTVSSTVPVSPSGTFQAGIETDVLPTGQYSVTFYYSGDNNFAPSDPSSAIPVTITVAAP
jgi:DNA-binding beta-propeller fold protein YncE